MGLEFLTYRNLVKPETREFAKKLRKNPTASEQELWGYLCSKRMGVKFRRQAIILGWIVDFWCPSRKLIVELDGSLHDYELNAKKDKAFASLGFRTLRINSRDVFTKRQSVLASIRDALIPT